MKWRLAQKEEIRGTLSRKEMFRFRCTLCCKKKTTRQVYYVSDGYHIYKVCKRCFKKKERGW